MSQLNKAWTLEFHLASLLNSIENSSSGSAGEEPQSFVEYDTLVADIAKLDGIEEVSLDWQAIEEICRKLLTDSSKDLKVANILAFSWFQQHAFEGLSAGFQLLDSLVNVDFSADLYPKRKKKQGKLRAGSFLWLAAKLEKQFQIKPIESISELDGAEGALSQFKTLNTSLKSYLEEDAPLFQSLKATFERFQATIDEDKAQQAQLEKEQAAPVEAKPAVEEARPAPVAKPAPVVEMPKVTSAADINKALTAASKTIKDVASQLKEGQAYSPNVFYLNRVSKWMLIQELPASGILERQPNEQSLQNMQSLEANNSYADLLNLAELEFNNGAIFYLALHRYVHLSLVALGQEACADVVLSTTVNFVSRFPQILETTFKSGEPFVDELTKAWLSAFRNTEASSDDTSAGDLSVDDKAPWVDARNAASKLLTSGKPKQAMQVFQEGIKTANGLKETIYWRYEMSVLLSKTGHDDMVVMQLQHIQELLNQNVISTWQPELSVNVIKLMLDCHKRIQQKIKYEPTKLEEVKKLKQELIVLSPSEALAYVEP